MKKIILILLTTSVALITHAEEIPLRIATVQEFSQLNPITLNLASTEAFMHFVLREMTTRDEKGVVIADLAEKIPVLKNKKAIWSIQKNAKWGDGKPVICQDWWLGWQAGLSPNTATQEKNMYSKIANIEWTSTDLKKCTVTYTTDSWAFDRDLPYPIPYHLENEVFQKWKNQHEAYDQNSLYVKQPDLAGLYNGPYKVTQFKLGSHFVMVANSFFYGTPAQISPVLVKYIGEANSLMAHLQTKDINAVSAVGFPPDLSFEFIDSETSQHFKVFFQVSPVFQGIFFNHENEFLKNLKVRQALTHAIPKADLVKAFFKNRLKPAETFIPPYSLAFKDLAPTYNVQLARKLLDEAGWKVIADRKFRIKDGQELVIDFKTSSGIKILEVLQVYICAEFAKIQVGCAIKNQPPRILLGDTVTKGDFGMAMFGNSILPDTSLTSLFSSKEIPKAANSWTGGNNLRWSSKQMDLLLEKFDQEPNVKKRYALLTQIEKEILAQAAFIPIYHRQEAAVMPDNLKGMTYLAKGTNFSFPEKWTLK